MKSVIKTAFLTSLYSYALFFLADYIRPGFVSDVFSVHLFLIPVLIFGVWLAVVDQASEVKVFGKIIKHAFALLIGIVLFVIFWKEGGVFGDFRLVLAVAAFILPLVAVGLASRGFEEQDGGS